MGLCRSVCYSLFWFVAVVVVLLKSFIVFEYRDFYMVKTYFKTTQSFRTINFDDNRHLSNIKIKSNAACTSQRSRKIFSTFTLKLWFQYPVIDGIFLLLLIYDIRTHHLSSAFHILQYRSCSTQFCILTKNYTTQHSIPRVRCAMQHP